MKLLWMPLLVLALAQEGHPLTGTWIGDWGPTVANRNHLTLVLTWDGKKVSGIINPGLDSIAIDDVFVNVNDWTIRIETDAKDAAGNTARISVDGRIEDLGSRHRRIVGTWRQGTAKGDFKITRE
jgi:hypothetical protein